ncbi:hypothetical protein JD844_005164 [Phrynosoma platyrhinos]|uniref:Microtubule-actin cross-linking factor 1 n=1 Tax=Phrynosoma platyrhinos TaxID=52577 RepID=A0ABQ7TMP0_PHRPL|nr:hypothetical protein JD844_005164 [Phrynosoma platyrhinos]
MKLGQAEDSRVLSEQLSQQMDYELQLMTYRAFVESQQKSPVKRRRMLSSSDTITQEFMDLRTRYTALVTLTTQHVKYISDALRRLEEEEKVVEEEKQERVDKVKELLGWVTSFKQSAQFRSVPPRSKELGDIEKSILEQQVLNEELVAKKEQVSEAIKTAQIFVAKHSHKLSGQEKEEILGQLNVLQETYDQLCSDSTEQLQQLQSQMAQETAHKGTETVAGVLDLGTMQVFHVWGAMQKGLLDQETGLLLLEAQVITGGLVVPSTGEKLSLSEGVSRDIINVKTYQLLQELQRAVQLVDSRDFKGKPILPLEAAMSDGTITESIALKISEVQLLTGGFREPSSHGRISLEEALKRGMITTHFHEKLDSYLSSCKSLIDPNSARRIGLNDLLQQCILDQETGLRLLPVRQLAGGMVSLTSDQKVNIFRAVQEGLIETQVAVRLLEAQLFAGGIVDPKSGHRLTVEEAARHNLIDQDLACVLLVRQLQTGGIVDTVTGERLSLDEAVKKDLVASRMAVVVLESLWSFRGLLQPESGEILPVTAALDQGILSSELAHKILSQRQCIKAIFIPQTREIVPWEKAVDGAILSQDVAKKLKSTLIPDVMPNMPLADSPTSRLKKIIPSSDSPVDHGDQSEGLLRSSEERMLFYLMTHSYVDTQSGQKLLLLPGEEVINLAEIVEPTIEKVPYFQPIEASKHQPQGWEVVEDRKAAAMESEPCNNLAWKELELHFSASQKKLEKDLTSDMCPSTKMNETVCQDVGRGVDVKKQKKEVNSVGDFGSEMGDSKREPGLITTQNRSETELSICESLKKPSTERELRDMKMRSENDKLAKQPAEEEMILSEDQERVSETGRSYTEKETNMSLGNWEKMEDSRDLQNNTLEKVILAATRVDSDVNWLTMGKVENGSIETLLYQAEGKITDELSKERQLDVEERVVHSHQTEMAAFPKLSTEEDDTLNTLITQLCDGGIINEQTGKKMLLDESVACGVVPSHTAIKLMGELKMFGGFFDAETCESLTTDEVIHEGLMDEKLLQKVLASDQAISGVIDPLSKAIYSIKDSTEVGLLDKETAARILEGQVVTGGIVDFKRGKKVSVTLASKLGLVERPTQEELKKLEKASKGKGTDSATKEKLISLQAEIGGIVDPKTNEPLTVPQAVEKGLLSKEKASQLLMKQIAEGGILHHKTGMRLSVEDAVVHGLIDQGFYDDLKKAESVCYHQYVHPETKELMSLPQAIALGLVSSDFQSRVQGIQASTGSIFDPVSGQKITLTNAVKEGLLPKPIMEKAVISSEVKHGIIYPENCRLVPYSELVRKSKIDVESGQRYLEVVPFRDLKDERNGNVLLCPQAVKLGKVEPTLALRLLQTQAETGGLIEPSTGQRLSLAAALEAGVVDEDMAKVIAVNQLLRGGIVSTESRERVTLKEAVEIGVISKKLASAIQESSPVITGSDEAKEHDGYQPQLLLPNGTSKTEVLAICKSNDEKQSAVSEATDPKISEEATTNSFKGIQEMLEETGDSVLPSLPLTSVQDSLSSQLLGEGKLESELALMLDPVGAMQLKAQKKDIKKKNKLKREELRRGEVEKQVIERKKKDVMKNKKINGDQEQKVSAQEENDSTALALEEAERTICFESQETSASGEVGSASQQENEEAGIVSEEPSKLEESKKPASDEPLFGYARTEEPRLGYELRGQDHNASESVDGETSKKKKKTKRSKKQGAVAREQAKLSESSQQRPSQIPVPGSKENLMQRVKEELTSDVQVSFQGNISGSVVKNLLWPEQADGKRQGQQAFGKEEKEAGIKENITDDQKVSIFPKIDVLGEGAEQETRSEQDSSLVVATAEIKMVDMLEETVFQGKTREPCLSNDEVSKAVGIDDTKSFGPSETEALKSRAIPQGETDGSSPPASLLQENTIQEVIAEDVNVDVKVLPVSEEEEETWHVDSQGGKIFGPEEQTLQKNEFPEVQRDSSARTSPKPPDAALKMTRESESANEASCVVEDEDKRWLEAPKLTKTPLSKQLCLEYDEKLVALLSRVRDIEMSIQRVQPPERSLAALQDLLRQAETLDAELKTLSSPVTQDLEAAKGILASRPQEVPEQLLKALEKDAKNLQRSFGSASESLATWLLNLHTAVEEEKTKVLAQHETLQGKLQGLLSWVSETARILDSLEPIAKAEDAGRLNSCLQSYKEMKETLTDTKAQLDTAAFDLQVFISEHAQELTPEQSRQLLRLLNELQSSFRELSERLAARTEVLQVCLQQAEQTDQVTTLEGQPLHCTLFNKEQPASVCLFLF